jgi:hypothetical protein
MHLVMGMLPRHFPIAGKPPPAATSRFPDVLYFKLATMDLAQEFNKGKGSHCEVCDSDE